MQAQSTASSLMQAAVRRLAQGSCQNNAFAYRSTAKTHNYRLSATYMSMPHCKYLGKSLLQCWVGEDIAQLLLVWLINHALLNEAQDVGCVLIMGILHVYKSVVLKQDLIWCCGVGRSHLHTPASQQMLCTKMTATSVQVYSTLSVLPYLRLVPLL